MATRKRGQGRLEPGMTEKGNVDLYRRPRIKNPDGSTSTVNSMSSNIDGTERLYPGMSSERLLSQDEARDQYLRTGQHLGGFRTPQAADRYAARLHRDQANLLSNPKSAILKRKKK